MKTLDKLSIRELMARCRLGVTVAERRKPQDILVTVTLHIDLTRACRSDQLTDSVDYKAIKLSILSELEKKSFKLIERVAQRVADISMRDGRVERVTVVVQKPGALRHARCSEVEIDRERKKVAG
jgi:FolB domain-containing protein